MNRLSCGYTGPDLIVKDTSLSTENSAFFRTSNLSWLYWYSSGMCRQGNRFGLALIKSTRLKVDLCSYLLAIERQSGPRSCTAKRPSCKVDKFLAARLSKSRAKNRTPTLRRDALKRLMTHSKWSRRTASSMRWEISSGESSVVELTCDVTWVRM